MKQRLRIWLQDPEIYSLPSFRPPSHKDRGRLPTGKETILRHHLLPVFGGHKLDAITNEDVQRLKTRLHRKAPKTVNNVLTVLNTLLRIAVEWDVIERLPCKVRLLPAPLSSRSFHDFDGFERLVAAASKDDQRKVVDNFGDMLETAGS
ncbi:MAG: hypothetical protein AB7I50_26490 [Vicinamibacterales bacterium]